MKKYYATFNVNKGGSFAPRKDYPSVCGDFWGNNLKEMKKQLNAILRQYNADKRSPFGWFVDISGDDIQIWSKSNLYD